MDTPLPWLDSILVSEFGEDTDKKIEYVERFLREGEGKYADWEKDDLLILGEGGCNPLNPNYARSLCLKINKATLAVFAAKWEIAIDLLAEVRKELEGLDGEHKEVLLNVMLYFVEELKLVISGGNGNNDKEKALQEKRKGLQNDSKSQAVILYMKASIHRLFPGRFDVDKEVEYLLQVTNLDPNYYIWGLYAYQALRYKRRMLDKMEMIVKAPSTQEMNFCEKAYQTAPNILTSFCLGMVLKDCLWMSVYQKTFRKVQAEASPFDTVGSLKRCLELFDDTIRLAKQNDFNDWVLKCTIHKAQLLCHKSTDDAGRTEGLNLFLELITNYPDNAYYHQKIGRIFQFGVRDPAGEIHFRDVKKTHDHLMLALSLHQGNYSSCLRDYMTLFCHLPSPYPTNEALNLISESLTAWAHLLTPETLSIARIWRGCLIWIYNPDNIANDKCKWTACQDWLHVLLNSPQHTESVLTYIWKSPIHVYVNDSDKLYKVRGKICTTELKMELEKIKVESEGNEGVSTAVEIILKEIERNPQNLPGLMDEVGGWSEAREASWKKRVGKSLADQDDNWRS